MANLTKLRDHGKVILNYAADSVNSAATSSIIFTEEAHLHSDYPNHDFVDRVSWNESSVGLSLESDGVANLDPFTARVFISLDAKIWYNWIQFDGPNITIVDIPFNFLKVVRDDTTEGDLKVVVLSHATQLA
jgi:hypothetical protein